MHYDNERLGRSNGIACSAALLYGRFKVTKIDLVKCYIRLKFPVISSIVHIAHDYEDESNPWPIQIEDHDGNLHSVCL